MLTNPVSRGAKRLTMLTAVCALGALAAAPSAFAADAELLPLPKANPAAVAAKYHTTTAEVIQRQRKIQPVLDAFTPRPGLLPALRPTFTHKRVAKAAVDGCFKEVGGENPTPDANGKCPAGYQPKINADYAIGHAT